MVGDCERQEAGGGQACGDGMTRVAWGGQGAALGHAGGWTLLNRRDQSLGSVPGHARHPRDTDTLSPMPPSQTLWAGTGSPGHLCRLAGSPVIAGVCVERGSSWIAFVFTQHVSLH